MIAPLLHTTSRWPPITTSYMTLVMRAIWRIRLAPPRLRTHHSMDRAGL